MIQLIEERVGHPPNLLSVLSYHRVDRLAACPMLSPRVTVTPEAFEQQMSFLATNYHAISMPELIDTCRNKGTVPPRSVMVTFDDAYHDFAEHAWPILKRHDIPATLFVPTAFPDHPERVFWWDWLHHAVHTTARNALEGPIGLLPLETETQRNRTFSRLRDHVKTLPHEVAMGWVEATCAQLNVSPPESRILSWDQLRRLSGEGVTLGAHTRNHPMMNHIAPERARAEAVDSLRDLQREIGRALPIFAYPGGGFNDEVVHGLKREGFMLAFTTIRGINQFPGADRLRLRRLNVGPQTTLAALRAQLLPWPAWFPGRGGSSGVRGQG